MRKVSPEALLRANIHFLDEDHTFKSSEERDIEASPNIVEESNEALHINIPHTNTPNSEQPQPFTRTEDRPEEVSLPAPPLSPEGTLLVNDVGLISLANSSEPKYLGHSSGITFARLIFAAAPQSQGLSVQNIAANRMMPPSAPKKAEKLVPIPQEDEVRYFVDAFFEVWHPLYPFLDEVLFQDLVARVQARGSQNHFSQPQTPSQSMDLCQLYLVVALGSKILEARLSTDFSADAYHETAMFHTNNAPLHESIRGVQVLLLLVLSSLSFAGGLNAWYLNHTILASCLDLGLQRKYTIGTYFNQIL